MAFSCDHSGALIHTTVILTGFSHSSAVTVARHDFVRQSPFVGEKTYIPIRGERLSTHSQRSVPPSAHGKNAEALRRRVDYAGKILTQTTNFKKNERVCKALNLKHRLMQGRSKLDTDVSKLRGKEKVRYKLTHDLARLSVSPDVKDWNSFLIVLLRNGITTKEKVGKSGRMNLYYCVGKQSFWSMKLDPFLTRENLERVFRERTERRLKESESVIKRAERHAVEEPKLEKKATSQPRVSAQSQSPIQSHKPIIIPPLPFEFLWDVPKSDEATYRRGETVYTFARKPADRYKAHYWIWHAFKTGKPQCNFDPPKSRDIPPAFLQQMVSSGKPTSTSSPQSESSYFRMSHVSLSNAPNDDVCISDGEPVSVT